MTVLGAHTIQETLDLMKTVEFRLAAGIKMNAQITMPQIAAAPDVYTDMQKDLNGFQIRWATARDKALNTIAVLNAASPLVSVNLVPCEPVYNDIKRAINVSGNDTYAKGDLTDVLLRIEKFAGQVINELDHPMPTGYDPDLLAYKQVDDAIKTGEAAAAAASSAVVSRIPWWAYVAGIGAIGTVGYIYVSPLLPRKS